MNDKDKNDKNNNDSSGMAIGMCIGVAIGAAVGAATDNIGLWLPIGLCLGPVFNHKSEDDTNDKQ